MSKSSQAQQTPDPSTLFDKPLEAWQSMLDAHIERVDAAFGMFNRYEGRAVKRSAEAMDEWAKLSKDGCFYMGELAAEWRKLALDSSRRMGELLVPSR